MSRLMDVMLSHVAEPQSPVSSFVLPAGYLDPQGELHTEVVVRAIGGNEEDMLASEKVRSGAKMNQILTNCTQRIGSYTDPQEISEAVMRMLAIDRQALFIAIRIATNGLLLPFEHKCEREACGATSLYEADLSELEIKQPADPKLRSYTVTLSDSTTCVCSPMTGLAETKIESLAKRNRIDGENAKLTLAMAVRISAINGQPMSIDTLRNMSSPLRQELREAFEDHEGGFDLEQEMECPSCGHKSKMDLELSSVGFFFPSRLRRKFSKTK